MHLPRKPLAAACAALLALSLALAGCSANGGPSQGPAHIFVIVMENHATNQILGNTADAPYLNQLAGKYGVARQYFGVTHPSLPNYLALISGDTQGIWDDCAPGSFVTCAPEEFIQGGDFGPLLTQDQLASATAKPHLFDGKTIVDELESHNISWKAYMESMPAPGYTGESYADKLYAAKHNPFVYFKNVYTNPDRMSKIVPYTQFDKDLSSDNLPNFVWISPNQCNDMHGLAPAGAAAENIPDCGYPASGLDHGAIHIGDTYISKVVPQIMHSKAWNDNSVIVIVWDEDDYAGYAGCCKSPVGVNGTVLGGANAPILIIPSQNAQHIEDVTTPYNHYSLLGTIQKVWGLDCLANTCGLGDSNLMTKFFGQS
jgi:hypothetical protein